MKDYDAGSFRSRSFAWALTLSAAWHLFWFFSFKITIHPERMRFKTHPRMVSLGPVMDDSIFRTLVETKPEISKTLYRRLSDFPAPMEPPAPTVERRLSGQVVGVRLGKGFLSSERDVVGGDKLSPDDDFYGAHRRSRLRDV